MVLEKRSEYGFHGYQIPTMPRGCRSARKKRSVRHNASHAELCAIDLLATVAGNLLLEKDVSASPRAHLPVKDKDSTRVPPRTEDKPVKVEPCDQGSCDEGAPVIRCQKLSHKHAFKETKSQASTTTSGFLGLATELVDSKLKAQDVSPNARHSPATIVSSPAATVEKEEEGMATPIRISKSISSMDVLIDQSNRLKKATEEDEMELDTKPPPPPRTPVLASSDSSVEVPAAYTTPRNFMPRSSSTIPMFHDKYTVDHEVSGDGDEDDGNSSACTHPSSASPRATSAAPAYRPQRIGDRRIRKLLSSRFWKVGPAPLKDGEFYDRDLLRSKKLCYTRQKTQRSSFKRKKLFERSSVSSSSAGIAAETISKLSSDYNNNNNGKKCIKAEQGNGTCSSITSHRTSFKSEDYKVKLKIKSFKVPELFIEMPETATVGSLKRAVLETVTAMLGNGLKVGVIYQGRKVRDDSRTLLQAGISGGDKLDSLNFSLEPNPSPGAAPLLEHGSPSTSRPEPVLPLEQCRSPRPLTARLPALNEALWTDTANITGNPDAREQQLETKPLGLASAAGSDNSSKAVSGYANSNGDPSRAIVPVSSNSSKELVPVKPPSPHCSDLALAVVPASNKCTRRPEMAQRRTRRPFSVSEVEALVQAVEKLGTGRWRDVKLQAFETAKHRTYVDLKDKWKTLVHTARISPQQRRGEPVPQDLLDRVLVAHAHWSQHQARLQSSKHVTGTSSSAIPQQQSHSCVVAGLLPPPQHTEQQQLQPLALTPPKPAALV